MKVYGPYTRDDGRQHVVLYHNGHRKSVSYPKWLWEQTHSALNGEETIDHIDGNPLNNDLSNLQVLSRGDNIRKSHPGPEQLLRFRCPECRVPFHRAPRVYRANQKKQGKAGPFCGRSCAGTYSQRFTPP